MSRVARSPKIGVLVKKAGRRGKYFPLHSINTEEHKRL